MIQKDKRLIIIDSSSVIYRAYHALPPLKTKKGELVNAVYGFLLVFFKAVKDFRPDFIVAAFDSPGPTFRHHKFKDYKGKRPKAPQELTSQIPKVRKILQDFGVATFAKAGFEADDLIGTIAELVSGGKKSHDVESIILSGDLDIIQLVGPKIKAYALRKGVKDIILYDEKLVEEKFQGLKPKQILDFKSLRGDPSDNIPGVAGVGEKTATELLLRFGNLENLYQELEKDSPASQEIKPGLRNILLKDKGQAFLSKELAEIKKDVSIDFHLTKCQWKEYNEKKSIAVLKEYGFHSLAERLSGSKEAVKKKEVKTKVDHLHDKPDSKEMSEDAQKPLF